MLTVDEILASGEYTDRRFRLWEHSRNMRTGEECWMIWEPFFRRTELTPAQMRLLIERDQHRDECRGLAVCEDHPVPSINCYYGVFEMWPPGRLWSRTQGRDYNTLSAAMDAARALAVGE